MAPGESRRGPSPWVAVAAVGLLLLAVALAGGGEDGGKANEKGARAAAGGDDVAAALAPRAAAAPAVRAAVSRLDAPARVAQLFLVDTPGRVPRSRDWGVLRTGAAGAPAALRRALRQGRGVAPLIASEQGLPAQPRLGRASPRRIAAAYRRAGAALRRRGVRLALGLSADVGVSAGPFTDVAFGDDVDDVVPAARAALDGMRSAGVAVAVGHFPGQGAATQDPLDGPASVGLPEDLLRSRDLVPFRALAPRASVIMVSSAVYAAYGGATPAALSPEIVRGELRERLGFRGVAMTDRLAGITATTGGTAGGTAGSAAVEALRAGVDLIWAGDEREAEAGHAAVLDALRRRKLPAARVREALERVLELKRGAGLLP